jgi:hypothetical protein
MEAAFLTQIFANVRRVHSGGKSEGRATGLAVCRNMVERLDEQHPD